MPRQLKTFVTTSGFFELAVAAPTMKTALEIWGAGADLFRRGYAKETNDAAIVNATMTKPGTVLRRAVGTKFAFKEHADLPDVSRWEKSVKNPAPRKAAAPAPAPKLHPVESKPVKAQKPTAAEKEVERKAARLYEGAQKKRQREAARVEAAERRARRCREKAIEKAEAALRDARSDHDERVLVIEKERDKLEQRARAEEDRWDRNKRGLEAAIRKARA